MEFLQHYRPRHLGEALGLELTRAYPLWLFPWSRRTVSGCWCATPEGCPDVLTHFSEAGINGRLVSQEFRWLDGAFDSISKHGFCPERFNSIVLARRLECIDGESVYLVLDGNHRISTLVALDLPSVPIRYLPCATVCERDVHDWPNVRNGVYTEEDARRVFRAYFEGSRAERTTNTPALVVSGDECLPRSV